MAAISDDVERIEEIAVAVENADVAVTQYETLFGLSFEDQWEIADDHIRVRAADVGTTQIQVLEPTADAGPVYSYLQSNGEGLHHICLRVPDLASMIAHCREVGARLVPEAPVENDGTSYIFVHPESTHGVLIELLERP